MQFITKERLTQLAQSLKGMPILQVFDGSAAQNAGLTYGDIILSVNGKPTSNAIEYGKARELRQGGMSCVVFRNGQEFTVDIEFSSDRE